MSRERWHLQKRAASAVARDNSTARRVTRRNQLQRPGRVIGCGNVRIHTHPGAVGARPLNTPELVDLEAHIERGPPRFRRVVRIVTAGAAIHVQVSQSLSLRVCPGNRDRRLERRYQGPPVELGRVQTGETDRVACAALVLRHLKTGASTVPAEPADRSLSRHEYDATTGRHRRVPRFFYVRQRHAHHVDRNAPGNDLARKKWQLR